MNEICSSCIWWVNIWVMNPLNHVWDSLLLNLVSQCLNPRTFWSGLRLNSFSCVWWIMIFLLFFVFWLPPWGATTVDDLFPLLPVLCIFLCHKTCSDKVEKKSLCLSSAHFQTYAISHLWLCLKAVQLEPTQSWVLAILVKPNANRNILNYTTCSCASWLFSDGAAISVIAGLTTNL